MTLEESFREYLKAAADAMSGNGPAMAMADAMQSHLQLCRETTHALDELSLAKDESGLVRGARTGTLLSQFHEIDRRFSRDTRPDALCASFRERLKDLDGVPKWQWRDAWGRPVTTGDRVDRQGEALVLMLLGGSRVGISSGMSREGDGGDLRILHASNTEFISREKGAVE